MALTKVSRQTLEDLLALVRSAPMAERRRRDMLSAINTVARALDRRPAEILVDVRLLNARLKQVAPVALGIAPARWRNVLSLFRSSLALMGPMMKGRNEFPMSEAWAGLHSKIPVRGDRIKLSRPLRWLSEKNIAPESVTAEDLERFRVNLCEQALLKNAESTWVNVTLAWNRAVERVPGGRRSALFARPAARPIPCHGQPFPRHSRKMSTTGLPGVPAKILPRTGLPSL